MSEAEEVSRPHNSTDFPQGEKGSHVLSARGYCVMVYDLRFATAGFSDLLSLKNAAI